MSFQEVSQPSDWSWESLLHLRPRHECYHLKADTFLELRENGKITVLTLLLLPFSLCSVMMYPAGPGSGDSPEGFPEQPRLQPQIDNCTAQTQGTETGGLIQSSLLQRVVGAEDCG